VSFWVRAVVTRPGAGKAWVADIREPELTRSDDVVVQMLRVGVCGTDRHVMNSPRRPERSLPTGDDYLVMGHEAVGRVVCVGDGVRSLRVGDVVVPTVRRGCGECRPCAVGQADLCLTGNYCERGIVGLHGFLTELIVERDEHLVRVPEELSVVGPFVESPCTPEKAMALRLHGIATWVVDLDQPRRATLTLPSSACPVRSKLSSGWSLDAPLTPSVFSPRPSLKEATCQLSY
jgi:threonine dehydrogenase-like Zn-dependent dehydrogenase